MSRCREIEFSPIEVERIMQFIEKTEAACEFIPEGDEVPLDVAIRGIQINEQEPTTTETGTDTRS